MSTDNPDAYEVTCVDCNTTKSYFTSQGVTYFKLSHQGHNVRMKEERAPTGEQTEAETPRPETGPTPVQAREPAPEEQGRQLIVAPAAEPVKLANLVVDVVDDGDSRVVEVYGIAGGRERFSKTFYMRDLDTLNLFLEAGSYTDPSSLASYTWAPEKIDLSDDVAKMLDEPVSGVPDEKAVVAAPRSDPPSGEAVAGKEPERKAGPPKPQLLVQAPKPKSATEEALLGKLSFIQPGEEYRVESIRVSKVLRKFRWNTELPYVIGAMFDDLLSIQSQSGNVKGPLIEAISNAGYTFVAVEAPSGAVTAWFRKQDHEEAPGGKVTPHELGS